MRAKLLSFFYYYFSLHFLRAEFIVKIDQGFLNGTRFETRHRNISAFLGIPYAQPPIDDLRFKNPLPRRKWDGIRPAAQAGNSCSQISSKSEISGKEDCLFLNVYTPLLEFKKPVSNNTLFPVMVWIHGGAFAFESSDPNTFGPKYLLDKDIILVSMNYRLGIFGFLTTGDSAAPGNFGLKDQVLALKWVKRNIRRFGGNPDKITIFGESAGGACVNLHAISDLTDGLFHQYIIQSGSALSPWIFRKKEDYEPFMKTVAENVGCLRNSSEEFVNCLRNKSVESLLRANPTFIKDFPVFVWVPTNELKTADAFLIDSPRNLISRGKMKDLPFISGTVRDEGLLVTLQMYAQNTPGDKIKFLLKKCINSTSKYYVTSANGRKFRKLIEDYYFNKSVNSFVKDKLLKNFTTFVSDSGFLYPQASLIEKMAKESKSPFYFYSFGYFSLNMTNMLKIFGLKKNLGVPHAEEIAYLFSKSTNETISKKDEKILNLMVDLWTSFAIEGKPSSGQLKNPNLWQPYVENRRFLQIGNISNNTDPIVTMVNNYFSPRMNFWKNRF